MQRSTKAVLTIIVLLALLAMAGKRAAASTTLPERRVDITPPDTGECCICQ